MKKNKLLYSALSLTLGSVLFCSSALAVNAMNEKDILYSTDTIDSTEKLSFEIKDNSVIGNVSTSRGFAVCGVGNDVEIECHIADETIAKVEYADKTQIAIACLKEGKTTLTVRTSDGQTAEIEVIVEPIQTEPDIYPILMGDVTDDGVFDVTDIICFQRWLLTFDIRLENWGAADFNNDDQLDVFDFCLMKRALISTFKN